MKKTILCLTALLPVLMLFAPAVQAEQACVHEYGEWVLTLAPTCMEKGEVTRTCTLCNEVQTATVAQGAHKESDWTLAAAPEIGVAGSMQKLCTVCGEILATEELAALPDPHRGLRSRCPLPSAFVCYPTWYWSSCCWCARSDTKSQVNIWIDLWGCLVWKQPLYCLFEQNLHAFLVRYFLSYFVDIHYVL